jgi:hypothetical protein
MQGVVHDGGCCAAAQFAATNNIEGTQLPADSIASIASPTTKKLPVMSKASFSRIAACAPATAAATDS